MKTTKENLSKIKEMHKVALTTKEKYQDTKDSEWCQIKDARLTTRETTLFQVLRELQ